MADEQKVDAEYEMDLDISASQLVPAIRDALSKDVTFVKQIATSTAFLQALTTDQNFCHAIAKLVNAAAPKAIAKAVGT